MGSEMCIRDSLDAVLDGDLQAVIDSCIEMDEAERLAHVGEGK